jgi:hypothetical protein
MFCRPCILLSLWIVNQLDALIFSNIFIYLSLSTCFGHCVPIIRRDPIALTQLLYLSFRFSNVSCEHCGCSQNTQLKRNDKNRSCVSAIGSLLVMGTKCPKHVGSDRQINIFEKISASSWFAIHKDIQQLRH